MKIQYRTNLFLILSTILIFSGMLLLLTMVYAGEDQKERTSELPEFHAIQHAQSVTIGETNSTSYSLQLNDSADKSILFSDRPDRIVETQNTQDFIGNWTSDQYSFQLDPPNAALVVLTDVQVNDIFEIELFYPRNDKVEKTLRYDFNVLGNVTAASVLPDKIGISVLMIDSKSQWSVQYSGD